MVKVSLSGKKQTTTQALGAGIAMVGNDHCVETDYPVADSLTVEILETVETKYTQSEVLEMCGPFGSVDREALVMAMVYVVDGGMSDSHAIDAAIELHPKADRKKLEKLLPLWG